MYKQTQGVAYPSLEPPVIDNQKAIDKGYISTTGVGVVKIPPTLVENADKIREDAMKGSDDSDDSDDGSGSDDDDSSDESE